MSTESLFSHTDEPIDPGKPPEPVGSLPLAITENSKLTAAYAPYQTYMEQHGKAENTIKAFMGDIRLLHRYFVSRNENPALGDITTEMLNEFLHWLCHERKYEKGKNRGKVMHCRPKSYARRVTSIKSFFGWLFETGVIVENPAAKVKQRSVRAPMPNILTDAEVERLKNTARDMLWSTRKPDARPYLLVTLLLQTAMKKSEVMKLALSDIDTSNPHETVITVRYSDPRLAHKERKLLVGPGFVPVYKQYLRKYQPEEKLFECSPRNLEYVLSDLAQESGLKPNQVSFEILRWTSAVRAYRFGMPPEALRQKMGLSPISWRETFDKIKRLASPGL